MQSCISAQGRILLAMLAALSLPAAARAAAAPDTLKYVITAEGNEARYRAREQLAGFDLPNDAIGKTSKITGQIVLDERGKVIRALSKIDVDVASLASDSDRRDNFVQRNTLQTAQYPTVTFVPTELKGLKFPLGSSGEVKFQMLGDLTVRNVTRPVTWEVTATLEPGGIVGAARTSFTFADFEMTKPRVRSVLSLDDVLKLEYDFRLKRQ